MYRIASNPKPLNAAETQRWPEGCTDAEQVGGENSGIRFHTRGEASHRALCVERACAKREGKGTDAQEQG